MKEIAVSENIEDFTQRNYIYIDKTEYIYNLVTKYERVFISRPRRFGKSLTLNTIGTLFEKGVEPYFKDTFIYDKWCDKTYPVLHLSFLRYSVNSIENFKSELCNALHKFARKYAILEYIDNHEPPVLVENILDSLKDDTQIVLLIDEYDCQLTANINNPELYEQFRTIIRNIYAVLKGKKQIRFMMVTGVTRLRDVSIFSVGSDIKDISYSHAYSQMIGFTREEIKKFYIDYLKLGISYEKGKDIKSITDEEIEEFIDSIAAEYDGYCFDEFYQNKVFSTYSVNNFLQALSENHKVTFGDYWYEAGGLPSILVNYLKTHTLDYTQILTEQLFVELDDFKNPTSLLNINQSVLMCQTGYLTLKSPLNSGEYAIKLGFANHEVKRAFSRSLARTVFYDKLSTPKLNTFNLEQCTADEFVDYLNSLLKCVAYDLYPIVSEHVLRSMLQFYFIGRGLDVRVEEHNYKGRSDLVLNFINRRLVLELKYSPDGKNLDALLSDAISQIKDRDYGQEQLGKRELIKIALVFDGSDTVRQISKYKVV